MAKSQETWNKKEKEKIRAKKKEEKAQKKEERKANGGTASFNDMIAYVDEYGNISSTPPDPNKRKKVVDADSIEISVSRQKPVEAADLNRKGTVTFFNDSKGFGFIRDSESQDSIFTHINSHIDSIKEGDKVSFLVEQGPKGLNAVEVRLVKP